MNNIKYMKCNIEKNVSIKLMDKQKGIKEGGMGSLAEKIIR
jgi:hypothetical protein